MEHHPDHPEDRAFWRAYARGLTTAGIDPLDLAAFVDGRLDASRLDEIEAALAADPGALHAVVAARDILAETPAAPPVSLLTRACDLRPAREPEIVVLRARRLFRIGGAGLAAAASLLICLFGYRLGTAVDMTEDVDLVSASTFGVFDTGDDLDLVAYAFELDEVTP